MHDEKKTTRLHHTKTQVKHKSNETWVTCQECIVPLHPTPWPVASEYCIESFACLVHCEQLLCLAAQWLASKKVGDMLSLQMYR